MELISLIEQELDKLNLTSLPQGSSQRFVNYLKLLEKWNRGQNLTAVKKIDEMVARHLLDSLVGRAFIQGQKVLDLGSGAGLPGVPLSIACPDRQVTLLDSRRKRIQFLLHVKQALGLDNLEVIESRLEQFDHKRNFDTLTARAFMPIQDLIPQALPRCGLKGRLVVWQGVDPSSVLKALGGKISFAYRVNQVYVPGIRAARHIAVISSMKSQSGL